MEKRGRPSGGEKGSILSIRVSPKTKWELETAARKNGRTLSREVEGRLVFTFGRYGTGRPDYIADLAEIVARLAQSVEREMRGPWDRDRRTRECLVRAFTRMVDVYSGATFTPPQISVPGTKEDFERGHGDPAMKAISEVIFSLMGASTDIYPGADILAKIYRRWERRRRRK
jgi:hypothetical protein